MWLAIRAIQGPLHCVQRLWHQQFKNYGVRPGQMEESGVHMHGNASPWYSTGTEPKADDPRFRRHQGARAFREAPVKEEGGRAGNGDIQVSLQKTVRGDIKWGDGTKPEQWKNRKKQQEYY